MFASGRNQRNCAALANESGELPVNLEPEAVLIAIEILLNITLYLRDDVVHVKPVVATALMAIARKVIAFDFARINGMDILGAGAVVLALGIVYWLMDRTTVWGERNKLEVSL